MPTSTKRRRLGGIRSPGNRPRREKAHVALGPAPFFLDAKGGCLDAVLRIPIRMAAACHPSPEGLDDVLPSGGELASRADVLEHSQLPVRPQDALDLRQCPGRISHAAKNQTAHHRVEGTVAEGQLLDRKSTR